MIQIPKQLDTCRFILVRGTGDNPKAAIEQDWTVSANYTKDEILKLLEVRKSEAYGVLCGHKGLVVVDCDDSQFELKCLEIPEFLTTFRVRTASKKLNHFYFYTDLDEPVTKRLKTDKKIGDVQGAGAQVIGPSSTINGATYDVINDAPIRTIPYFDLLNICTQLLPNTTIDGEKKQKKRKESNLDMELDPLIRYIKARTTIPELLLEWGIKLKSSSSLCACPLGHTSVGGQCFSYQDHQFNCFNCSNKGSMFDLVRLKFNISFPEARTWLAERIGVPLDVQKKAQQFLINKNKADASEFLVEEFLERNRVITSINDEKPEMFYYKDGIYNKNGKTYIEYFCSAMLREWHNPNTAKLVIYKIQSRTGLTEDDIFNTNYETEIPVENGILDVLTRKLSPFTPEKIFFNKLPVVYDPEKDCAAFKKFLSEVVATQKDVDTLQEFMGYCLYKSVRFKKSMLLIGDGDNGKSVFLNILNAFLNPENVSNLSLQSINDAGFSRESIHHKLANINADIGHAALEESEEFKKFTAGDFVEINRKFKSSIRFKPYTKMIFSANNVPSTEDKSDGFFTRWIPIKFPFKFHPKNVYDNMSKEEQARCKVADATLTDRLSSADEFSGIMNFALDGLQRLIENRTFSGSSSVMDVKRTWYERSDSFILFMDEYLERADSQDEFLTVSEIAHIYNAYCRKFKFSIQSARSYNELIQDFGATKMQKFVGGGGARIWVWEFLKWKKDPKNILEMKQ